MKVTTASWFEAKKLRAEGRRIVSISRGDPKWMKPDHKIWAFCPGWDLINGWRDGELSEEDYRTEYLRRLNVDSHLETLQNKGVAQVKDGDVLCCWEKEGFCHRDIVADILEAEGIEVERR